MTPLTLSNVTKRVLVLVIAIAVAGCAVAARELETAAPPQLLASQLEGKPEVLHPYHTVLVQQGPRNLILNQMRIGLAAFELGAYLNAAEYFDEALRGIEAIYANNETAAKARELFTRESYKDFKGEPYERAMAYYYRGLLYLRDGDYENARASFKGGMLQDAFAEEEQSRADFALLAYLEGWASHCLGDLDLAKRSFAEANGLRPEITAPPGAANLLFLAEIGTAPIKYGDGPNRSRLKYQRGNGFTETTAIWDVSGTQYLAHPVEDVYWQASTRGGRPVDHILARKVAFKENTAMAGTVMKDVGMATMLGGLAGRNQYATMAGGAVMAFGFLAQAASDAARPEADARYWDTLPDSVHVLSLNAAPHTERARALFLDPDNAVQSELTKSVEVKWAGRCGLAVARSRSAVPVDPRAPNSLTR